MAYLNFEENIVIDDKKGSKAWSYIENIFPGSKELLHETCAMLTLMHFPVSIRQNKKSKKDGLVVYKYHLVKQESSKSEDKLLTIYINNTKDYHFRIFTEGKKAHEATVVKFDSIESLRQGITDWMISL